MVEQLSKSFLDQGYNHSDILEIGSHSKNRQEKILQFGEGNFLRAFIDFFIDEVNEKSLFDGSIVIVPPIAQTAGSVEIINRQDGCYTVVLRGLENNVPAMRQRVITSISRAINPFLDYDLYMGTMKNPHLRFIVSNTTEAGIFYLETDKLSETEPPVSFPAKITALLYERYKVFDGAPDKGFIFIPCELIDDNGSKLKENVLQHAKNWGLSHGFVDWIESCNHFTNTLVDRIVTGYPKDEAESLAETLGYRDDLLVTGEIFHFFAIEAKEEATKEINETFAFERAGLNIVLTNNVTPYKMRKVRILNGAHTMSVPAAILSGKSTVGEMMTDSLFTEFLRSGIYQEIIPSLDMDKADLISFADSVFDRFANPYIKHNLFDIALNSISKFKARVLPTILDYHQKTGEFPKALTLSFAALLVLYTDSEYKITDSADVLEFFHEQNHEQKSKNDIDQIVKTTLSKQDFWGMDLSKLPGLCEKVAKYLYRILAHGIEKEMKAIVQTYE